MKRLYQKIYLTIIVALLVVVLVAGAVWRIAGGERREAGVDKLAVLIAAALPAADASVPLQRRGLIDLAAKLNLKMALYDRRHHLIASSGDALPPPTSDGGNRGWRRGAFSMELPDGRYMVTSLPWRGRPPAFGLIAFLASVALVVGMCAYPVVRGLTRRLERLQSGVEGLGSGNFKARVEVKGRDEVARLANSFNEAAARIETLLGAHQQLLANASHELRTPLARLAMGIELAKDGLEPGRKAELRRDLAELDDLIEEILTASRLQTLPEIETSEPIDLLALAAEECARYDNCTLDGEMVSVVGEARLLRRLIRNLLDNARRYGRPPIDVAITCRDGTAVLDVIDAGEGIPEAEREKIFDPFYRIGRAIVAEGRRAGDAGDAVAGGCALEAKASGGAKDPRGAKGLPGAQGSGIGLALVRQIARHHGGEAMVVPRTGRPSDDPRNRIRVTLPIVATELQP